MNRDWRSVIYADIESQLAPLSRRRFLVSVGKGSALFVASPMLGCADNDGDLSNDLTLSSQQERFFSHLAQVLLPASEGLLTPLSEVPVIENLNKMFADGSQDIRDNLSLAINLFEYGSWFLGGHFSRFSRLEADEAKEYIDQWQSGHYMQQGIVTILKKLVYASYWQDERTWPPLAFEGPVSDKWGLKPLGAAPLPTQ